MNTKQVFCALLASLVCMTAWAGEPEQFGTAPTFRFIGGERIKVVAPEALGGPLEQIVTDDGYISLPSGGEPLNIRGKTVPEAVKLAVAQVEKDVGVKQARVSIALQEIKQRNAYVGGEGVKNSQNVPLSANSPVTLYGAIIASGGVTPDGDPTNVTLTRPKFDGSVTVQRFDITLMGEPDSKTLGPILEAGDVVKVPRGDLFILAGEVTKGGPINRRELGVPPGRPVRLSNLISASGGLKQGANRGNVKIIRTTKDGERQIMRADLDAVGKQKGGAGSKKMSIDAKPGAKEGAKPEKPGEKAEEPDGDDADPVLQDGDVVMIDPAGAISVLGRVRLPGVYPLNGETVKLTRAIALAGGFAEFAKQSQVIVWKMSHGFSPRTVDMSLLQKNGYVDIELEEGDVVYVGERLL